ncbi:hypothetical protein FS749_010008 [Ceratobasidium sp. UAMH 11750]|nr:hypothetical protein FS749_010008 [Ceratobasidium sp. UAMH 11750]
MILCSALGDFSSPRKLRWMDSTTKFKVLASIPLSKQLVPTPASIPAVGEITTVTNCNWFLAVGVFARNARRTVMFVFKVRVPDNNRFKKLSIPRASSTAF